MPNVALYARYSTDNQSVVSIEDQFRICREHAGRERWQVVDTYHDAAISGASVILRPGVQSLLQDAQRGKFDIVLAEALDRVSRDQADVATLFKRLRFAGVSIVTLSEGEISELHVGLKGTMNALFLKDLAMTTIAASEAASRPARSAAAMPMAIVSSTNSMHAATAKSSMNVRRSCDASSANMSLARDHSASPPTSTATASRARPAGAGLTRPSGATASSAPASLIACYTSA